MAGFPEGAVAYEQPAGSGRRRILFLPAWYPSAEDPVAGVFVQEQARAAQLYHEVAILYAAPGSRPGRSSGKEGGLFTARVTYPQGARGAPWAYLRAVLPAFRRLRRQFRPQLLHAHVTLPAGLAAVLLGGLYGLPVVLTEHAGPFAALVPTRLRRWLARYTLGRAQAILPVSRALQAQVAPYAPPKVAERFCVVPNAVNTDLFYPAPDSPSAPAGPKRILCVSALSALKGIGHLLEAVAQMRARGRGNFVVEVVGNGAGRGEYEGMAARMGLGDIVAFHGRRARGEVADLMRACAFLVLPSLAETFGVVLVEAMACGKPVLATRCGGPEEIVTAETGLLVPAGDAPALAEAMALLLDRGQSYDGRAITLYARAQYGYEAVGRQLDKVYRQVLESSSSL